VRVRRVRNDDPFEDYYDYTGQVNMGSVEGHRPWPYDPLEEDVIDWEAELKEREARRIPLGFQLPGV
jgi:hypothetical protein